VTQHDVVAFRALSDDEAIAWLVAHAPVTCSNAELARQFGWNDTKVARRLAAWARDGRVVRQFSGLTGGEPIGEPAGAVPSPAEVAEPAVEQQVPAIVETPVLAVCRVGEPVRGSWGHRLLAYVTAVALATAAAYFSIGGLAELFPAQATAVTVLGALLEGTKLVMVAWLAANWRAAHGLLRLVMVLLVLGLVTVNAGGTYARLVESHLSPMTAASTSVGERIGVLDARIAEAARRVAGIEVQERELGDAIGRMKPKQALAAAADQAKHREALARARQEAADALVVLEGQRAGLEAERARVAAQTGPTRFLAAQLGTDPESVIRWLVALLVMLIDPSAVVLTIAASRRK